jgi:hypothetical protein
MIYPILLLSCGNKLLNKVKSLFPHDKSKMGYIISIIGLGGILGALLTQKLKHVGISS